MGKPRAKDQGTVGPAGIYKICRGHQVETRRHLALTDRIELLLRWRAL